MDNETREMFGLMMNEFKALRADMQGFKAEVCAEVRELKERSLRFEAELSELRAEVKEIKADMNDLKAEVKRNTITTEKTVQHAIAVMADDIAANANRFDRVDFDTIKQNTEIAVAIAV